MWMMYAERKEGDQQMMSMGQVDEEMASLVGCDGCSVSVCDETQELTVASQIDGGECC